MEMVFLLYNGMDILQNKYSSYGYITLANISLGNVFFFLYKMEMVELAPNSVNTHLNYNQFTVEWSNNDSALSDTASLY